MEFNKILIFTFFVFYLILNVLENWFRDQEKFNMNNSILSRIYQKLWKRYQFIQWSLVFITLLIALRIEVIELVLLLLTMSLLWTFLYDGLLNILNGRNFFYVSKQTESVIEKKFSKHLRSNRVISWCILILLFLSFLALIIF